MEFEKYADRAKGFLQSAQPMALRRGHQWLTPEHLLKILLEDPEGLCANLIRAAGGDPKAALTAIDAELEKGRVSRALTLKDLQTAHARGQNAIVQSVEGAHFIEGKIERIEEVYKRGLRDLQ